ncbi:GNAT family N-acetyltransferase [Oryzibacter oryziterrae]|uniref:GNAT family N-acetyltransferase n=1 Tax=Oryzibacter oryziterrae TaxID=2766474 RepID=UPI001F36CC0C|nr:GNAT family N-acetyltransferase [Oryzibacter oryziterrae]
MDVSRTQAMTGQISISDDLGALRDAWRQLERTNSTPFQSFAFVGAWFRHIGLPRGQKPLVVVFGPVEAPRFLLPLTIGKMGPLRVAAFPGGCFATQNVGVGAPPADALPLLTAALAAQGIDLLLFADQPVAIGGESNPLVAHNARLAPHPAFAADLDGDFAALITRHGGGRKRHRLRTKLKAYGEGTAEPVAIEDPAGVQASLDVFFCQKAQRFAERGLPDVFAPPQVRQMFKDIAEVLEVHTLCISGRVAAVLVLGKAGSTRHLLMSSFDPIFSKASPGESLLHLVLERCGEQGVTTVDFGPGAERYKTGWADRTVPLMESTIGLTLKGRVAASLYRSWRRLRATLAASKRLRAAIHRLRRRSTSGDSAD